ncbi:F-box only protein 42 [Galendromus occidentalis]|uniref:F-box only protein 42 n=1 Tax=Galendromus occidentalis TaxID=34638 RepID=A0AAJ7WK59_9ACAR|nr:F-box only protein 42 [Galendromus occidentalis]
MASINDLPEYVLEYILLHVSPYSDLKSCSQVNHLWNRMAKSALEKKRRGLNEAVQKQALDWFIKRQQAGTSSCIQKRHSHACAVLGRRMYIFGGCTSNTSTTYNDLWSFDLSRRVWVRPLSFGTPPPPKACSSLIAYKEKLVLFGGWAHTSPYYPLYNSWRIFDSIHLFDPALNRWTEVARRESSGFCPATAGHSAALFRKNLMLLFGGLQALDDGRGPPYNMSNDIWLLDLRSMQWQKQTIEGKKPKARYGHSQIIVDDHHIFIIGGCSGPDEMLYDMWLLEALDDGDSEGFPSGRNWKWHLIEVTNQKDGAPRLSFHPACRVGDNVVILGRSRYAKKNILHRSGSSGPSTLNAADFNFPPNTSGTKAWQSTMCVYALNISELVEKHRVTWLERGETSARQPEHLVLYTLVKGEGELLMFGGIRRDSTAAPRTDNNVETASNTLYSLSFQQAVI